MFPSLSLPFLMHQCCLQNCVAKPSLPKSVVRGCEECKDCQKVMLTSEITLKCLSLER